MIVTNINRANSSGNNCLKINDTLHVPISTAIA